MTTHFKQLRTLNTPAIVMCATLVFGVTGVPVSASSPRDGFIKSCQVQMYMSQVACECLADKAEAQLDAAGIAYLSLGATDVAHTAAAAKAMSTAQMAKIDKFMKTGPHACEAAHP